MNIQSRMDMMTELAETLHDVIRGGWADRMTIEREGSEFEGQELRLVWMDDGSVEIRTYRHGDALLRCMVEITVHPLDSETAEKPNEPTGPVKDRTWGTVPAGWFVQTPKGEWVEVGNTSLNTHSGKQVVSLRIKGEFHAFERNPRDHIKARRGSLYPDALDEAVDALESVFKTRIIEDNAGQS